MFPAFRQQSGERGGTLGLFFAPALPFPEDLIFPAHPHDKGSFVFAPGLRDQLVNRAARGDCLEQFLQLSLRVDLERILLDSPEVVAHFLENELAHGLKIAVEIKRSEEGFEGIGQGRIALPPAACFLPAPELQMTPEIEPRGVGAKRFARDEASAPGR